eukprot:ANDGO_05708.mRNA.1 hypothetical protein
MQSLVDGGSPLAGSIGSSVELATVWCSHSSNQSSSNALTSSSSSPEQEEELRIESAMEDEIVCDVGMRIGVGLANDRDVLAGFKPFRYRVACIACRSSKRKCDGLLPCARCVAKGVSHCCAYEQHHEKKQKAQSELEQTRTGEDTSAVYVQRKKRTIRTHSGEEYPEGAFMGALHTRNISQMNPVLHGAHILHSLTGNRNASANLSSIAPNSDQFSAACSCLSVLHMLAGAEPSSQMQYQRDERSFSSMAIAIGQQAAAPDYGSILPVQDPRYCPPVASDLVLWQKIQDTLDNCSSLFRKSPYWEFINRCRHLVTDDLLEVRELFRQHIDPHPAVIEYVQQPPEKIAEHDWFFRTQLQRSMAIVDQFPFPCLLFGNKSLVVHANSHFLSVSKWTMEEMLSEGFLASWTLEDDCLPFVLKQTSRAFISVAGYEFAFAIPHVRIRRKDGKRVEYCASLAKVFDTNHLSILNIGMFLPMQSQA